MVLGLNAAGTGVASGVDGVQSGGPAPARRPQRAQRPGYCSSSSSVSAGALGRLALTRPPTR
jgi:hypothetical protein